MAARRTHGRALTGALATALVMLLAASGYLAVQTHQRNLEEQRRQDILAAARVAADESVSRGRVIEAGIATLGERSARVLVVADGTVPGTAAEKGRTGNHRLQLDLVLEDGRWRTSDVEFVD